MNSTTDTVDQPQSTNRLKISRAFVLGAYTLLLLSLVLTDGGSMNNFLSILPLLLFLPGILRQSWLSHIWLCFILLIYFLVNINNIFSPKPSIYDYFQTALIPLLFISAMLYCRWIKQAHS